jgi:hypothetical protein
MNHAVAVALKGVAIGMRRLGIMPPACPLNRKPEMSQAGM